MRHLLLFSFMLLVAGCAQSSASTPTPTVVNRSDNGAWFTHPPKMTINARDNYRAIVATDAGTFTITLLPRVAPLAVNNFVFLSRHRYYDKDLFIRIIHNFMIQTGDVTNTGLGTPGYTFPDEPVTMKYTRGTVAMANRGKNTNGSQFFIVTGSMGLSLPKLYTIFGKVTQGMNVVDKIGRTPVTESPTGEMSQPLTEHRIRSVTIHVTH